MDCAEVLDLLDAYALGAAEKPEAAALEEHVADCVRCWDEMTRAQQAAAMLALSIPLQTAPQRLGEKVMAQARKEQESMAAPSPGSWLRRLRVSWPATTGALALTSLAAIAFAVFLQVQLDDLRDDKDTLSRRMDVAGRQLEDQGRIIQVVTAGDTSRLQVLPVSSSSNSWGEYHWSPSLGAGFIICHNLPALAEGQVYQAWFTTDALPISAGTFVSADGNCRYPMEPSAPITRPTGVGVSREPAGGSEKPGEWVIFASFQH